MNYEEEIKKLKRMNFRMFSSFRAVVDILNERERDELLNNQVYYIMKEVDYESNCELIDKVLEDLTKIRGIYLFLKGEVRCIRSDIEEIKKEQEEIKNDINDIQSKMDYLMTKQKERENSMSKYFTYESSEEDEDEICCCKSLPPQQPCPEIEEYLKSISD